jgi:23S rRNA A1618 N6-methylase RlmF
MSRHNSIEEQEGESTFTRKEPELLNVAENTENKEYMEQHLMPETQNTTQILNPSMEGQSFRTDRSVVPLIREDSAKPPILKNIKKVKTTKLTINAVDWSRLVEE